MVTSVIPDLPDFLLNNEKYLIFKTFVYGHLSCFFSWMFMKIKKIELR